MAAIVVKLYPAMDLLGGRVVRLERGRYDRVTEYSREPERVLEAFANAGAERVHIVDLDGARVGAPTQAPLVHSLLRATGLRVQIGGGIRTIEQLEGYAAAGAERFVLGTAAVKDPAFVRAACERFAIVVAVDAMDGKVALEGWTEASAITATELARRAAHDGARAVLYTDIQRDGTGAGPNVTATVDLARAVPSVEVIASGGIGSREHIASLARAGVAACVVGRALYDGTMTVQQAMEAAASG
jgi:phosphoribosylformimino-5-aminoimidazole carboxamide ribotide isomerase